MRELHHLSYLGPPVLRGAWRQWLDALYTTALDDTFCLVPGRLRIELRVFYLHTLSKKSVCHRS